MHHVHVVVIDGLEATAPSPAAWHNGNHLTAEGVRFVLDRIVVPTRDPAAD